MELKIDHCAAKLANMTTLDITNLRLHNQRLSESEFKKPVDVVKWLGAVQAQDYYGAKWALGQRTKGATDETIEKAFAAGAILRTHVMRPTWHFVAPADIRWMLSLTAARVNNALGSNYRKLELDDALFRRSNKALATALKGDKHLTRQALRLSLERAGIATDGLRLIHLLARAELDGVVCSGARAGKQFTYALLDERAPQTRTLSRDEALAELARRYFTSHGPATLQDFGWWSGLTASDTKSGLDMVQRHLVKEVIAGQTYWLSSSSLSSGPTAKRSSRLAYLLAAFDEYLVGYTDRSAALDPKHPKGASRENAFLGSSIVVGGKVVGTWKRTFNQKSMIVTLSLSSPISKPERLAVTAAARSYGAFLGMTTVLV